MNEELHSEMTFEQAAQNLLPLVKQQKAVFFLSDVLQKAKEAKMLLDGLAEKKARLESDIDSLDDEKTKAIARAELEAHAAGEKVQKEHAETIKRLRDTIQNAELRVKQLQEEHEHAILATEEAKTVAEAEHAQRLQSMENEILSKQLEIEEKALAVANLEKVLVAKSEDVNRSIAELESQKSDLEGQVRDIRQMLLSLTEGFRVNA